MLHHAVELGLGFLAVIALLVTAARRLELPYPILLVVGGLILGFVPGLPRVGMAPELVFLLFLPPLLYAESFYSSCRAWLAWPWSAIT